MFELGWLKDIVKALVLPPLGPLILAVAGLGVAGWRPRIGIRVAWGGVVILWLLSLPAVGTLLVLALVREPPFDGARAADAQAIVILGGGTRPFAPEYGQSTPSGITLARLRYGARIARQTNLPILVSGGPSRGAPAEALLMRDALVNEFRVPVRWIETRSRDTHENAVFSAAILRASGVTRVVLVGHSFDFPRTRKEFEAAGMTVFPAPIGIPVPEVSIGDFLPSAGGLQLSYYATYELLANLAFDLTH